jgi:hypothetical protein
LQDVQVPVFVDVVERGDPAETASDLPVLVIPSVVGLQPSDRSTLLVAEIPDFSPFPVIGRPDSPGRWLGQDRERRLLDNRVRNVAAKGLDMKVENEVVERARRLKRQSPTRSGQSRVSSSTAST